MKYEIPTYQISLVRERITAYTNVDNPSIAADVFRQICCLDASRERWATIYLDGNNRLTGSEIIAIGSSSSVIVPLKEVFRGALVHGAGGIICGHNHPSGDPKPSPEDIEVTRKIIEAGKVIGMSVLDHVIVTDCGKDYSFASKMPKLFES
jgi:DNA repair protein RadC